MQSVLQHSPYHRAASTRHSRGGCSTHTTRQRHPYRKCSKPARVYSGRLNSAQFPSQRETQIRSETPTKLIRGLTEVESASKKQYAQRSRIGFLSTATGIYQAFNWFWKPLIAERIVCFADWGSLEERLLVCPSTLFVPAIVLGGWFQFKSISLLPL